MSRIGRKLSNWTAAIEKGAAHRLGPNAVLKINQEVWEKWKTRQGESGRFALNGKLSVANRLAAQGRLNEALDLFQQICVQMNEKYGSEHHKTTDAQMALAITLIGLERNVEASDLLRCVVDKRSRMVGSTHRETLRAMLWLGYSLQHSGNWEAAEISFQTILDVDVPSDTETSEIITRARDLLDEGSRED